MKISIIGAGYVGLSNALLLARYNEVVVYDIDKEKIKALQARTSFIKDKDIQEFLADKNLNFKATLNQQEACQNADFIIIATPTDYDETSGHFNTCSIENAIKDMLSYEQNATIIIKSTIPIGYTESLREKFGYENIIFSPEFLREGKALYDNLYPSRIIVGSYSKQAQIFASLLAQAALKKDIATLFMHSKEAEAIKLFANTYLAMRVAYFNEIDSFAQSKNLSSKDIIKGVSLDPRIGDYYNNPSFGYGGYCLPKDTKQLLANFKNIPNNLIKATVEANETRKKFIAQSILDKAPTSVGFYRLIMKNNSDNFRNSAVQDIIKLIADKGIQTYIYEPLLDKNVYLNSQVIKDLNEFKEKSALILSNRMDDRLLDVKEKVFSKDIFGGDGWELWVHLKRK